MSSVKIVLRKNKTSDGKYPLVIRVTKDRKTSYIGLGVHVREQDWDKANQRVKKSHANSKRLNNLLIQRLAEATDSALELEANAPNVSVTAVRQKIKPSAGSTVFPQADLYLTRLKDEGKFNQYSANKSRVKHLKTFLKNDVNFSELTIGTLERFKAHLKFAYSMSERSAVNHLVLVRSIFSQAIKDGVCDPKYYPFGKGKLKIKFPDSVKVGLTLEEVQKIEDAELSHEADHARNLWLISFYFAGMRVSDVFRLKWSDFSDGRLNYKMGKNEKAGSLKVPAKAQVILDHYEKFKVNANGLVFPELQKTDLSNKFETQRLIAVKTKNVDELLKNQVATKCDIQKKLTMHIARHTFAQIAGDRIPIQLLQKLYRHSSITTTMGYQSNFTHKDTDSALELVIGN